MTSEAVEQDPLQDVFMDEGDVLQPIPGAETNLDDMNTSFHEQPNASESSDVTAIQTPQASSEQNHSPRRQSVSSAEISSNQSNTVWKVLSLGLFAILVLVALGAALYYYANFKVPNGFEFGSGTAPENQPTNDNLQGQPVTNSSLQGAVVRVDPQTGLPMKEAQLSDQELLENSFGDPFSDQPVRAATNEFQEQAAGEETVASSDVSETALQDLRAEMNTQLGELRVELESRLNSSPMVNHELVLGNSDAIKALSKEQELQRKASMELAQTQIAIQKEMSRIREAQTELTTRLKEGLKKESAHLDDVKSRLSNLRSDRGKADHIRKSPIKKVASTTGQKAQSTDLSTTTLSTKIDRPIYENVKEATNWRVTAITTGGGVIVSGDSRMIVHEGSTYSPHGLVVKVDVVNKAIYFDRQGQIWVVKGARPGARK